MMDHSGMMAIGALPLVIVIAFVVAMFWLAVRILHKAGYSGWWSLLGLVPIVNLVMIWVFAFADWPRLRRRRAPPPQMPLP
jgi:uncharacterized membrane protein YhaH (DUF805 family)